MVGWGSLFYWKHNCFKALCKLTELMVWGYAEEKILNFSIISPTGSKEASQNDATYTAGAVILEFRH